MATAHSTANGYRAGNISPSSRRPFPICPTGTANVLPTTRRLQLPKVSAMSTHAPDQHPYLRAPRRTLLAMTLPVLVSLIAEPLTGLADTAFVARLGTEHLAALGVGTMVLTSAFWVFSFLGVGTQTELANCLGAQDRHRASMVLTASLVLALGLGTLSALLAWVFVEPAARAMGGDGEILAMAVDYMHHRLIGAPAVLLTMSCFGALRGLQMMRAPLFIAAGLNGLNILLDWVLIFGLGPFPALGISGAAIATTISQWFGAIWAVLLVHRHIGIARNVRPADLRKLIVIGGDLFVRTAMVLAFLLLATRVATEAGAQSGAAHQAIRQFFFFTALFLDAFAITGQSLIAYFMGRGTTQHARHVAATVCLWSTGTGLLMAAGMLLFQRPVAWLLVPADALAAFSQAWLIAAALQPVNALSFATDGIHWGTGDFRYLRNSMVASALCGMAVLFMTPAQQGLPALSWVWVATGVWTAMRAILGMVRIWPGVGDAPLRPNA